MIATVEQSARNLTVGKSGHERTASSSLHDTRTVNLDFVLLR